MIESFDAMKSENQYEMIEAATSTANTTHLGRYLNEIRCEKISDLNNE